MINRIEGRSRDLLFENLSAAETRFAAETVFILTDMLRGVLDGGTGSIVRRRGFRGVGFGKTGTSSDYRDSWFCGATPGLVAVVWVGYDDNRPMYLSHDAGVTGASGAAPIWADFMMRATAGEPVRNFTKPPGITRVFMDPLTAELDEFPRESGWISVSMSEVVADSLITLQLEKALEDSLFNIEADSTSHDVLDTLSIDE
jgi:membrane carboxypeptidase/penicillin-binding protein